MFKLTLEGNKALLKKLDRISDKLRQNVGDEIEASTYNIQSQAIQNVPVDTGFLKNSITAENRDLEGQVEARSKYAPYVEFGTGGMVSVPAGLEDYAMKFKGKGDARVAMPPQPYLFPAAFAEFPKMIQRINNELKKEIK